MTIGRLNELYSFQKRVEQADDGYGNVLSDWVEQFTQRGGRTYMRGGEKVLAARIEGIHTVSIVVRKSKCADMVCPDWRVVDCRSGETYNIRSKAEQYSRQYVDFLVESGVADG